jgi:DNA-directed RNA polymerase subunit RPC12/RpoP
MQNLNLQLDALYELKSFLEQFTANLFSLRQTYQNKMLGLHDGDVSLQVADSYCKDFWDKNNKIISNIIGKLRETDYPYILRQIETIEMAIQAAGGGKFNAFSKATENIQNKTKDKKTQEKTTIIKTCAMCGETFETIFAQNAHCPKCFSILLKHKNATQNEREK